LEYANRYYFRYAALNDKSIQGLEMPGKTREVPPFRKNCIMMEQKKTTTDEYQNRNNIHSWNEGEL